MTNRYKLTANPDLIIRLEDGATIPRSHRWWDDYEAWLSEGNTPDPFETLTDLRARKLADINTRASELLATLSANYPGGEVQSWGQQTREAEAVAAEPTANAPLLTAIAAARGLTVDELASRVRFKIQAYAVASGQIIGQRQALEDALMAVDLQAADAAAQLDAITWPTA